MAGEARGDDPPIPLGGKDRTQRCADRCLARGVAGLFGIGRIRKEQAKALGFGNLTQPGQVGAPAVDRSEVELEVARVEDDALRRVDRNRVSMRHRVGDRDELDIERPDHPALAVLADDQLGAAEQPGLLDAVAGQPEGHRGTEDRERQLAQHELQPADVIFVAVGGDTSDDAVGVGPEIGEVG